MTLDGSELPPSEGAEPEQLTIFNDPVCAHIDAADKSAFIWRLNNQALALHALGKTSEEIDEWQQGPGARTAENLEAYVKDQERLRKLSDPNRHKKATRVAIAVVLTGLVGIGANAYKKQQATDRAQSYAETYDNALRTYNHAKLDLADDVGGIVETERLDQGFTQAEMFAFSNKELESLNTANFGSDARTKVVARRLADGSLHLSALETRYVRFFVNRRQHAIKKLPVDEKAYLEAAQAATAAEKALTYPTDSAETGGEPNTQLINEAQARLKHVGEVLEHHHIDVDKPE